MACEKASYTESRQSNATVTRFLGHDFKCKPKYQSVPRCFYGVQRCKKMFLWTHHLQLIVVQVSQITHHSCWDIQNAIQNLMVFYEDYRISERTCCFGVPQFFWSEACCKVEAGSQTQILRGGMWLKSLWFLEYPWLYQAIMELPQIGPTKRGYWNCWGPFVLTALTRLWYSCLWWFDMCIHSACCFFPHIFCPSIAHCVNYCIV